MSDGGSRWLESTCWMGMKKREIWRKWCQIGLTSGRIGFEPSCFYAGLVSRRAVVC